MAALPEKKCFKCGEVKPLSDFYKHPQMADGHVNKCKECNKKDVHKNRADNLEYVQEYDRNRRKKCNVTAERWEEHLAQGRKENCTQEEWEVILASRRKYANANPEKLAEIRRRYREDNPKKYRAHSQVGVAIKSGRLKVGVCEVCGSDKVHGHHYDYDKPLDVMWLCAEHHSTWHREHGEGLNAHYTEEDELLNT